jgi:hypothetical protein
VLHVKGINVVERREIIMGDAGRLIVFIFLSRPINIAAVDITLGL